MDTYNRFAQQYAERFMDMDLYHEAYDVFCDLILPKNAKVFEIACGPGNVTQYLLNKRPDLRLTGIDLAPNMVKLATQNNPSATFKVMDCRKLDEIMGHFDAVMCGFVMPYLTREECKKLIADVSILLKPRGIFYFSTMEGAYTNSGFEFTSFSPEDQVYIHYHQYEYLKNVCLDFGLEILDFSAHRLPGTRWKDIARHDFYSA